MSAKPSVLDRNSREWVLTEKITEFVNLAFERKLRPSRALYDAICSAKESGYSEDEIRIVYWVLRAVRVGEETPFGGLPWLKTGLMGHLSPDLALRHKGGINPTTGVAAKRWLDELLSRIDETNPNVICAILSQLPEETQEEERALFDRMKVQYTKT